MVVPVSSTYKIHGQTWYQWASELFRYENCCECGRGVKGHTPAIVCGNWFSRCKPTEEQQARHDKGNEEFIKRLQEEEAGKV